jgi:hypothetical protein
LPATILRSKSGIKVNPTLWPSIERSALLYFLIHDCLKLTKDSVGDLQQHWKYSVAEIEKSRVKSIPTDPANVVISGECLKRFGPSRLLASKMFYSFTRSGSICTCDDWTAGACQCEGEAWLLDVAGSIYPRGLLLPIRDHRGWYSDLLCFKSVRDQNPFILKVREVAA